MLFFQKNLLCFGWVINYWTLPVLTGYFIYDFFDMVLNQKLSQSWELLFHHIVVSLSSLMLTVLKKWINKVCSKIKYFGLKIFHLDHYWQEIMESFHLCKKSSSCTNRPQTNWAPKPYTSTPATSTDMGKTKYPSFLSRYKEQVSEEQRDNHSSVTTPPPYSSTKHSTLFHALRRMNSTDSLSFSLSTLLHNTF